MRWLLGRRTAQLKGMLSALWRETMRGLVGQSWERGRWRRHHMGNRALDVKDAAGWRAGEENEFTGAPGMESLLPRGQLSRTESAPSGV